MEDVVFLPGIVALSSLMEELQRLQDNGAIVSGTASQARRRIAGRQFCQPSPIPAWDASLKGQRLVRVGF